MISSIRLEVGQELKLEFAVVSRQIRDIRGKVKWITRVGEDDDDSSPTYNLGIEFLEINEDDRDFIDKFVFRTRAG